jgi:hypothetical protein
MTQMSTEVLPVHILCNGATSASKRLPKLLTNLLNSAPFCT